MAAVRKKEREELDKLQGYQIVKIITMEDDYKYKKKQVRVIIAPGAVATVDEDCSPETIEALKKLVIAATKKLSKDNDPCQD